MLAVGALALALGAMPASASAGAFTVQTLHFDTVVGPKDDTHCDVIGDLYRPKSATAKHRAAAILTTNGFGGSKNSQRNLASAGARDGYVVLSYSGLGFGGSGCKIQLDDRDWDGKVASQLISFLGGGKAAKDGTTVNYVAHDKKGSDGRRHGDDPRVGMVGGSYGGQVQYAAAGIDPRLDTIVPIITWNDLSYSFVPNSTDLKKGVTSATPGVPKFIWALEFAVVGMQQGIVHAPEDLTRLTSGICPNFDPQVCPSLINNAVANTPDAATLKLLRHASVGQFIDGIKIPTLLMQGEADTLFNLNESVATYDALRKNDVPVKLIWQSWGHSGGSKEPGEFDEKHPRHSYEGTVVFKWFDHYLRDTGPEPTHDFCFFRDWIDVAPDDNAAPAYACRDRYPGVATRDLFVSGSHDLVADRKSAATGSSSFLAPPEVSTSATEISALDQNIPLFDAPGTATSYSSAPLEKPVDVAGIPKVSVDLSAPLQSLTGATSPAGYTVLFFKLYDVAPDGDLTLSHRLLAPVRIPVTDEHVDVALPGIVHRFAKGHRIQLVVAGSDLAYRGNILPQPVTILTSAGNPGVVSLPVASAKRARAALGR
ncbi:MAG: hypothetical protein QOG62_2427 [Thermoleophilaceae bacterium]|nr:hypothetical protein [Thermoleophilaceae bacterium]